LKGESHYDEEKEIIQKQLKIERDELLVICQQHQVCLLSCYRSPGRCPKIPEILKFVLKCPEIGVRS